MLVSGNDFYVSVFSFLFRHVIMDDTAVPDTGLFGTWACPARPWCLMMHNMDTGTWKHGLGESVLVLYWSRVCSHVSMCSCFFVAAAVHIRSLCEGARNMPHRSFFGFMYKYLANNSICRAAATVASITIV